MYKILLFILFLWLALVSLTPNKEYHNDSEQIYHELNLNEKLELTIFKKALDVKRKYANQTRYLSIIDFTKASTEKRFFLIDLSIRKVLFNTYVAHGKNSGENYATKFSNKEESNMSSLGLYATSDTYYGKHGYSLRLIGLEPGTNHMAEKRAIVIHGADYVSEDFIQKHGRLGRSHGCPALPEYLVKQIIDITKGGSCLYIYSEKN
jgi:hypothetical protein